MQLASWNVNSLKVRLPHLQRWLEEREPDVVCLQELKQQDSSAAAEVLAGLGYHWLASGQKTYNGVAIASRQPLAEPVDAIPGFADEQKRVLAATIAGVRVICIYVPNGQALDSDKYTYKLDWLAALTAWLRDELDRFPKLALLGDFNIAPDDRDVHDPKAWEGAILCSPPERQAFADLLSLGLADSFRLFEQPDKSFSWWDYRMNGFRRNLGLRIDHVLLSAALAERCTGASIDREPRSWERPSDHAPVLATIEAG